MKRIVLVLLCGLLGTVLTGETIPRQVNGQPEISTEKLVVALRVLNTEEVSYLTENGRFADRDQMLAYLRHQGYRSNKTIDFENPQPYELTITTSWDGQHNQITLQRSFDEKEKGTWCKTAVFSDDKGVIFLGQASAAKRLLDNLKFDAKIEARIQGDLLRHPPLRYVCLWRLRS